MAGWCFADSEPTEAEFFSSLIWFLHTHTRNSSFVNKYFPFLHVTCPHVFCSVLLHNTRLLVAYKPHFVAQWFTVQRGLHGCGEPPRDVFPPCLCLKGKKVRRAPREHPASHPSSCGARPGAHAAGQKAAEASSVPAEEQCPCTVLPGVGPLLTLTGVPKVLSGQATPRWGG